jgi:hypothetical protein
MQYEHDDTHPQRFMHLQSAATALRDESVIHPPAAGCNCILHVRFSFDLDSLEVLRRHLPRSSTLPYQALVPVHLPSSSTAMWDK